ncbi:hypothetical protein [Streptomyces marianii]|uniref:Uncharacterized protein n=1 Tax=Streptomyces marianii TaxID=1817406 RepID=A0A5R9E6Y2_9ACTN|nr:hypothetical protein [Streptomyces marianii]TLQ45791.1 hypothetical protein FEF34_24840 [Streptomyces marianii]
MTPVQRALAHAPHLQGYDAQVFLTWFRRAVDDTARGRDTEARYLELSHPRASHIPQAGYLAGLASARPANGVMPSRFARRAYLRQLVRDEGGVWSTLRARRLCLAAGYAVASDSTSRRDLELLQAEGVLTLREPARRIRMYNPNPERTAA